ncbi:MAG: hypothetical protein A2931_00320 [Candidatus Niyogibacteria bacterium RIFCSPLOWO2_01_FULL_45_48]|uniref:PKD domain-containing protein n=1 Tax=Candidatus Niyogibacteria bacterium RIFCSPLOWO2_01_FULL_45_48 TaxID=1801724 RepID=A0A1G2EVH1_9BACT|nr:MAG: hypothetical protein A2931_00320 [Candidatus Niyogibacteria bacterium RIFCSPLOWO2_01_FULL_45_48]OGZ30624.1 MAG: hypothetical protein A2835_03575 [Candidatus Niyogibacteria bacterium RIFCSPHIGHO2_01_FULL_45_28]
MDFRRILLFLGFAFLVLLVISGFTGPDEVAFAGSEHNLSGWAWSETIGWISFNSTEGGGSNYGVTAASNGRLSGYAWSENIGWLTFNQGDLGGCPNSPCQANFDDDSGAVTGWARALSNGGGWDGWISLSGSNYGVSANQCSWSGWAWGSDVVGGISFNSADYGGGISYGVNGSGDACTAFAATLSALPSSGYAPLSTTLTGGVSGGTGTINYTFWWDCSNASDSVSVATSACGDPTNPSIGAKFDGVSETSKDATYVYSSVGSYSAKVIVERGTRKDEERVTVSANQPPEDFSLSSSNNIEANITSAPVATSTETIISVVPLFGFNSQVTLSVDSVTPALSGAIYNFRNNTNGQESSGSSPTINLTSGQFSAGADFWVGVPRESALQEYTIRIRGEGGGKIRLDVKLNASIVSPDFREI